MKMIRPKSLLNLFYTLFLLVPMAAIGVRAAYITFNKNAKDSYSGTTSYEINYKYESNVVNSINDLLFDSIYEFKFTELFIDDIVDNYGYLFFVPLSDIELTCTAVDSTDNPVVISPNIYVELYYANDDAYLSLYNSQMQYDEMSYSIRYDNVLFGNDFIGLLLDTNYQLINYRQFSYTSYNEVASVYIDNSGTLDNAFTYSIHELIDNNLGKVNFFTWFGNMFLDMSKPQTALYINFVNWYFNYILLVSLGYLLFYVIMWFINYVRKLLDHNDSFGHGGY